MVWALCGHVFSLMIFHVFFTRGFSGSFLFPAQAFFACVNQTSRVTFS